MRIPIGGVNGAQEYVELPASFDDANATEAVEMAAHKICLESARRKSARRTKTPSVDAWAAWVRPVCYRFIEHCIETGLLDQLRRRLSRYKRHTDSDDIFSVSLLAIFAEDAVNFTESDRYKISRQLWYAYRHYVPWEFLNGFLSQLHDFEKQKALSRIEPGFEDWIVQRRSVDYATMPFRGHYPKEIETRANDASLALVRFLQKRPRP